MSIRLSDHFSYRRLLRFTLPSILMMFFTSIYGVVDGLFVSNVVGETAFAAINLIMPYCMIFSAIGSVFGVGGSALVARIRGQRKPEKANQVFSLLVWTMLLSGLAVTGLAQLLLPWAVRRLGATAELTRDCMTYARIFLSTQAAFFLQYGMQPLLITAERPRLGLAFTVAAGVSNMVLDWLFIAVFRWGVAGAAIASCIGQCIGGIGPVVYFALAKDCPLRLVKTHFMGRELWRAMTNGAAEGITNVAMSFVNMVFNLQLMKYIGEYGVSAYGVIMYVNFVFVAVYLGYTMGAAPIFSFQYAAGGYEELRGLFRRSLVIVGAFSLSLTALALATARPVSAVFAGYDEQFLYLTIRALRLYSLSYFLAGINIFTSGLFAAFNNGLIAGILSGLRMLVFQLAAVLILPLLMGSDGIWLAMLAAESCVFLISALFLVRERKTYHYA